MKFGTAIAHLQSGRYQEATSWADQRCFKNRVS